MVSLLPLLEPHAVHEVLNGRCLLGNGKCDSYTLFLKEMDGRFCSTEGRERLSKWVTAMLC